MSSLKMALGAILVSVFLTPASPTAWAQESVGTPAVTGVASWYGPKFDGKRTASGERFDMTRLTAAHRTLPFDTRVRVTNPENGEAVVVRINDRGPVSKKRVIDLSRKAARTIGIMEQGVGKVRLQVLDDS